jgi:PAS domain S-box-containing protein
VTISKSVQADDASLREEQERLRIFEAIVQSCLQSDTVQELYEEVCRIACDVSGVVFAWVGREVGGAVHALTRCGEDHGYLDEALITAIDGNLYAKGPTGRAILSNSPIVVHSIADDSAMTPWREAAARVGFASAASLPLRIDGNAVASLTLHSDVVGRFTPALMATLEKLTSMTSFALSHIQQRDALNELQEVTAMRDYALTKIAHGLVISNATISDYPITFVNTSFEQLTGYNSSEVVGRNCRFLQGPDTDLETVQRIREALDTNSFCEVDLVNYKKNGESFWNHLTLFPFFNGQGELTRYVGVLSDISDRQRLESQLAQSQKLEAIGTLAGGIAHDFNNLLLVIQGYASILSASSHDEQQHLAATRIEEAVHRGARLTRQLLAYSRQQIHRPQPLNLNQAVRESLDLLEPLLRSNVTLKTSLHSSMGLAMLDTSQIQQCLFNLVANAAEAMSEGGTIQLRSRMINPAQARALRFETDAATSYAVLEVSDDGAGMDEPTRRRVFEPFFTTKSSGTGLGLASVYGIVRQSHGHVTVESELGVGTTFHLYFPAVELVPENAKVGAPRVNPAESGDIDVFGTETILIVENVEEARHLLVTALRAHGFTVLHASNGPDALDIARNTEREIDVLLADVIMPGMNGRELANQLLADRPDLKVIFTSGFSAGLLRQKAYADDDFVVIEKPYRTLEVARTIRQLLDAPTARAR